MALQETLRDSSGQCISAVTFNCRLLLGLDHGGLLGDVHAVEELPDDLVLDGGRLLDEGGALGHRVRRVSCY